ncbi:MAG: bifunctional hydroxymethylpyrimidine kinase/phosphomethylpyrimidine kinase [Solirubrobacteraceae bacterium]
MSGASHTPRAVTIAGSDSGGGAGIQADLKAFARAGVHGMSAITAITAQNTVGVRAIHAVPREIVLEQVRAVVEDVGVDAVKVGMLGTREVALAVAEALDLIPTGTPVVVDPVMVAESGAALGDADAVAALIAEVIPRASVITPNLPEARALVGDAGGELDDEQLLHAILALGPGAVVLTGGHREVATDLLLAAGAGEVVRMPGVRHEGNATHGSGCTHSSSLAAALALALGLQEAARYARRAAGEAVRDGLEDVGAGAGPVDVLGISALRAARG